MFLRQPNVVQTELLTACRHACIIIFVYVLVWIACIVCQLHLDQLIMGYHHLLLFKHCHNVFVLTDTNFTKYCKICTLVTSSKHPRLTSISAAPNQQSSCLPSQGCRAIQRPKQNVLPTLQYIEAHALAVRTTVPYLRSRSHNALVVLMELSLTLCY